MPRNYDGNFGRAAVQALGEAIGRAHAVWAGELMEKRERRGKKNTKVQRKKKNQEEER